MVKPLEEGNASRAGVAKTDLDRSNIGQPDANRFDGSRLYRFRLSREGNASGQMCGLLRCAELSIKIQIRLNGLVKLFSIHSHLRHRYQGKEKRNSERGRRF